MTVAPEAREPGKEKGTQGNRGDTVGTLGVRDGRKTESDDE